MHFGAAVICAARSDAYVTGAAKACSGCGRRLRGKRCGIATYRHTCDSAERTSTEEFNNFSSTPGSGDNGKEDCRVSGLGIDKTTALVARQGESTRSMTPVGGGASAASAAFPGDPDRSITPDAASAAQRQGNEFTALRVCGDWLTGLCPTGGDSDSMLEMARIAADRFLSRGSRDSNTSSVTNELHEAQLQGS